MSYKIAIVGESWGDEEVTWQRSFCGPAGDELRRLCNDAGFSVDECYLTDVFKLPVGCKDATSLAKAKTHDIPLPGYPAVASGKYIPQSYASQLRRLFDELETVRPNVVIALGPVACWALLRSPSIKKLRGTAALNPEGYKVVPVYSPRTVLAQHDLRHVTVLDFQKARRESEFPELRKVVREIWLDPDLSDIERFYREYWLPCPRGSFDIETAAGQITCIGFAPTIDRALVIPFCDYRKQTGSYWPDLVTELKAWKWVEKFLDTPGGKVGQNGLYDMQYLWFVYGIPTRNYEHDTMLLHHALQPESPKGLDFLGSVYTNEPAWKTHRPRGQHTIKRED